MDRLDIMNRPAQADSVEVNEKNIQMGIIFKNKHLLSNNKLWHKFVITNTGILTRDEILKAIMDHVHPCDLIPVFFCKSKIDQCSYFLARNCDAAIKKLCRDDLVVDHPYNKQKKTNIFKPFKINLVLNFSNTNEIKIDLQKNVLTVLQKRLKLPERVLDLDNFAQDPDLSEYCPLSQPKIMFYVLHTAKVLDPEEILLSNNNIKLLNRLNVLFGRKIKSIDLSNNDISSFEELSCLKYFNAKEIRLNGNPLCACERNTYLGKIKELCPSVEFLDGIPIGSGEISVTRRNFLCDEDSFDLANQFLEHFFTMYDSKDRRRLAGLYHKNAVFSVTSTYLPGQKSSSQALLKPYSVISRNLTKSADYAKNSDFIYRGSMKILEVFQNHLPQTEHDPFSFTTDLIHKTKKCAVIVVTGVFTECAQNLLDPERMLGFTRTFVLEAVQKQKWVIINEQLHVYNALTSQEAVSFREPRTHTNCVIQKINQLKAESEADRNDLINVLKEISNLKEKWAKKCLEECNYDLKESIELFVRLYKADQFPDQAFAG